MGAVLVLAAAIGLGQPKPSHAGTVTGAATEWTQLLNNAELAQIVVSIRRRPPVVLFDFVADLGPWN